MRNNNHQSMYNNHRVGARLTEKGLVVVVVVALLTASLFPVNHAYWIASCDSCCCYSSCYSNNNSIQPRQRSGFIITGTDPIRLPFCLLPRSGGSRRMRSRSAALASSRRRQDDDSPNDDNEHNCLEELENEEDPVRKKKIRMDIVRSLQNSFYQPSSISKDGSMGGGVLESSSSSTSILEPTLENGGVLSNLPLWRVQWTELPGRTNVLSVHEPMYTNMFEEIIRRAAAAACADNNTSSSEQQQQHRYFGHLYLPNGSKNLRSAEPNHKLKTWQEDATTNTTTTTTTTDVQFLSQQQQQQQNENDDRAAVLGTLMKITDFRRMEDGKLLLLVQAVERFVVTAVVQELPYGMAHVQLLPDREEIQLPPPPPTTMIVVPKQQQQAANAQDEVLTTRPDGSSSSGSTSNDQSLFYTEATVRPARASALVDSWRQWYPYEYESTRLPLPAVENMAATDVVGSAIAKVLPFAPFDTAHLPTDVLMVPPNNMQKAKHGAAALSSSSSSASKASLQDPGEDLVRSIVDVPQKPLEVCLLEAGILKEAGVPASLLKVPMGELEINLWLVLNDFLVSSRTPVSPVLLGLLPVGQSWPDEFILERIADAIDQNAATLEHKYVRVSPLYPAIRRQKRLSYYAAQLLERDPDNVNALRQQLLQIPSTKLRLAYILWKFETECGAFQ